jgi:hypothetical protein
MDTMKQTKIYLTNISCQKLQNIVGQGCSSAYQVMISESDYVGIAGQVSEPAISQASNENFPLPALPSQHSWLHRVLRSLGLKKG